MGVPEGQGKEADGVPPGIGVAAGTGAEVGVGAAAGPEAGVGVTGAVVGVPSAGGVAVAVV